LTPRRLLSGPFARVTVANFLFFLNFASFFLLPLHVKALGGSETTVGLVMGSSGMASILALPLIGMGIDRFGRRRFFVAGAAAMSAAALGFLFVHAIGPALFALRVVQGVSFAASFTAATTMAAELAVPERRAQALGIFGVSTLLTHAIGPAIGEEIVERFGFPALFVVAAACSMAAVPMLRGVQTRGVHRVETTPVPWGVSRLQWTVIVTMTLAGMGFGAVVTFVPTYVRAQELGRVALFYTPYAAAAILTRVFGAGVSDSLGRRATVLPALVTLAVSIAALAWVGSVTALVAVGALFGAAQGISYPTLHAFLVDLTPPAHLGRSQALFNGAFNLGVMSSAFVFGPVTDHLGHRTMFLSAAMLPLLAAALLYAAGIEPERGAIGADAAVSREPPP
jgi:MFS family permease